MTDRVTLPEIPTGLAVYLDSHDVQRIDATIAKLQRCGAAIALVPCESLPYEGPHGPIVPRLSLPTLARICDQLRAADITPIVYSFPAVDGDLRDSLAHYRAALVTTGAHGQLDAEPHHGTHWTPAALAPWLDADPDMSITTTRAEIGHLGAHGRCVWLQLERQASTATLAAAVRKAPDAILVTGLFDERDNPRTLDEIRVDLDRCAVHSARLGIHGFWSAHTMSDAEADLLRGWLPVFDAAA